MSRSKKTTRKNPLPPPVALNVRSVPETPRGVLRAAQETEVPLLRVLWGLTRAYEAVAEALAERGLITDDRPWLALQVLRSWCREEGSKEARRKDLGHMQREVAVAWDDVIHRASQRFLDGCTDTTEEFCTELLADGVLGVMRVAGYGEGALIRQEIFYQAVTLWHVLGESPDAAAARVAGDFVRALAES